MKTPQVAARIFDALDRHHPDADTELAYGNAFELLVATMLSAQSTDVRVNAVTPALFRWFPDAHHMAQAGPAELETLIHATGFFRQKAKALIGMSRLLIERHGGEVPASLEALTALPGVGRKTANVVLGHALSVPGLPVDRHVLRVSNRIGLVESDDPVKVEAALCALLPPNRWTRASDTLILHGRRICKPTPLCDQCEVAPDCDYFAGADARQRLAAGRKAAGAKRPAKRATTRAAKRATTRAAKRARTGAVTRAAKAGRKTRGRR